MVKQMMGSSKNNEIGTPDDLFQYLDLRFGFTYDAAASHENAKCKVYSTLGGTYFTQYGDPRLLDLKDGLGCPWRGRRVYVNPPYGHPWFRLFIEKAISERDNADIIVMLAKYDPSTENGRLLREHFHLEYLPRIRYDGMDNVATFPSAIAIAKPSPWRRP